MYISLTDVFPSSMHAGRNIPDTLKVTLPACVQRGRGCVNIQGLETNLWSEVWSQDHEVKNEKYIQSWTHAQWHATTLLCA